MVIIIMKSPILKAERDDTEKLVTTECPDATDTDVV